MSIKAILARQDTEFAFEAATAAKSDIPFLVDKLRQERRRVRLLRVELARSENLNAMLLRRVEESRGDVGDEYVRAVKGTVPDMTPAMKAVLMGGTYCSTGTKLEGANLFAARKLVKLGLMESNPTAAGHYRLTETGTYVQRAIAKEGVMT
jgi:hypothetical protein